ncbi:MAG: endonuclease VIII [Gammaproteobacteria bacterium]
MPEGPEIRLAADAVYDAIGSGKLKRVQFDLPQIAPFAERLTGRHVTRIDTHGKAMLTRFAGGLTMYSHNQLYGRWYTTRPGQEPNSSRALRVGLHTARGSAWLFSATDVSILTREEVAEHPFLLRLGPDILDATLTEAAIVARLQDKAFARRSLGALYLDQGFLAGNGNYLRSEILHFAGVTHMQRPIDLTATQRKKLARVTLSLARRSYRTRGLTNPPKMVAALKRKKWPYERHRFAVFGRAGQRCHTCKDKVAKTVVGSRRLYFCPTCQPGTGS